MRITIYVVERLGKHHKTLRVAEQYVDRFGNLAQAANTLILPANVADVASMIGVAMSAMDQQRAPIKLENGS